MGNRLEQLDIVTSNGHSAEDEVRKASKHMLQHGIYGIVLPLVLNTFFLETHWENCVVSVIGGGHRERPSGAFDIGSLFYPQGFPSADRDLFFNARLAYQNLLKSGYTRIGFVYSKYLDNEAHGRARAGFLIEQLSHKQADPSP
jgi:DNA-binding LacI/PurR family transcriptional regulator